MRRHALAGAQAGATFGGPVEVLMAMDSSAGRPRHDWLPRAIISGFIATVAMAILFFFAYGGARIATAIQLSPNRGAIEFTQWLRALTANQVLDVAASSLYLAAAIHLVVGVLLALVYAYFFEPRIQGPDWMRGAAFAVVPWILSLVVFLPLVGGGFFGDAIGAGPLPAIGNLILHLAYGATLGAIYGPLGDIPADNLSRAAPQDELAVMEHYEQTAARGIVIGGVVGAILGVGGAVLVGMDPRHGGLGVSPVVLVPIVMAVGAILGGLWGSISGLTATTGHAHSH
jgi:hypothetical protein